MPRSFFYFSKFWFFEFLRGSKVKKWPKMTKNCPSCLIFQQPCFIWFSFMVHMGKRIIYSVLLIFFDFLFFFASIMGWKGKSGPKWQSIMTDALHISGIIHHDCDFWYTCVRWWHHQVLFSFFQDFNFLGC